MSEGARDFWTRLMGGNRRKDHKVLLFTVGLLGVILLVFGSYWGGRESVSGPVPVEVPHVSGPQQAHSGPPAPNLQTQAEEEYLAGRLESMLGQINGVGEVDVTVRLAGSTVSEYAVNAVTGKRVTDEHDPDGARRVTTDENENGQVVVVRGDNGYETPVVEREASPAVAGVLVVAEGARDPAIKARLFQAVGAALGVDAHKILVVPKKL